MKIIVSGGGTGGHIIPAISIAEYLRSKGNEIVYIGNKNSYEERISILHNFTFVDIDVQKLYRHFTIRHIYFPFKLILSLLKCIKIFKTFQPDCFIGTGGFVMGPAGFTAKLLAVPIYLQEQNSYPGLTTRLLSKDAKIVFLGNSNARKYLDKCNVMYSGNPVSHSLIVNFDKIKFEKFHLSETKPKILVIGGSQGSEFINNIINEVYPNLLDLGYEILWQVGKNFIEKYRHLNNNPGMYVFDFSYELPQIYNSVELAISRGGALTLAELEIKKIPALIIPLPTSAGNHQYQNALEFQSKGFGYLLNQKEITKELFLNKIKLLIENKESLKSNFKKSKHLNASETIALKITNDIHGGDDVWEN